MSGRFDGEISYVTISHFVLQSGYYVEIKGTGPSDERTNKNTLIFIFGLKIVLPSVMLYSSADETWWTTK